MTLQATPGLDSGIQSHNTTQQSAFVHPPSAKAYLNDKVSQMILAILLASRNRRLTTQNYSAFLQSPNGLAPLHPLPTRRLSTLY